MANTVDNLRQRLSQPSPESQDQSVGMAVHKTALIAVTVGEIKAALEVQPNHPAAKAFTKAIRGYGDDHRLYVEKADLQGLLDNREVVVNRSTEADEFGTVSEVREKSLGEKLKETKESKPAEKQSVSTPKS